jgi:hypothetical protein
MKEESEKPFGQESSKDEAEVEQPVSEDLSESKQESKLEEEHRMSVDSDYYPATIPEESEYDLKMLESDEPTDAAGLPSELEPGQLAKLHNLKESNA